MVSRNLPFDQLNPHASVVAVAEAESSAFAYFSRDTAQQLFAAPWDMMQAAYQLAFQQALAAVRPQRSVLDLQPSVN